LCVTVPQTDDEAEILVKAKETTLEDTHLLTIWRQQFVDALRVLYLCCMCIFKVK